MIHCTQPYLSGQKKISVTLFGLTVQVPHQWLCLKLPLVEHDKYEHATKYIDKLECNKKNILSNCFYSSKSEMIWIIWKQIAPDTIHELIYFDDRWLWTSTCALCVFALITSGYWRVHCDPHVKYTSLSDNYANYRAAITFHREVNDMLFLTRICGCSSISKSWVKQRWMIGGKKIIHLRGIHWKLFML